MILRLTLTLLVALAGAYLAKRIHLPAAYMTGAMLIVIVYNFIMEQAYCPTIAKPFVQLIAGAFIAFGINRSSILDMKKIVKPLFLYIVCILIWALLCGYAVHKFGGLDAMTAFLACVPGGLTDISLMSMDMGANTSQVTTLQMLRMIMAVGLFPILTRAYVTRFGTEQDKTAAFAAEKETASPKKKQPLNILRTLLIACAGGAIGYYLDFPAGTLTGAMISTAIWNIRTELAFMPIQFRRYTQLIAGSMIGAMVTRADVRNLVQLIFPLMIIVCEYLFLDFIIAPILAKVFHIDLLTMILACTPAGAADMALIAGDMGGNSSDVAVFHVVRLCTVLTVFPAVIQLLVSVLP